jgi:tetratricopeptide (TPR) repeat protein
MPNQDAETVIHAKSEESERPLDLLAKRVDLLEIASHEKNRPWYRQPSTIVSVIALLVSLGATIYSQSASKQESIRSKKEELRKLVLNLIEVHQSMRNGVVSPSQDPQAVVFQHRVLLRSALRLVKQIPDEVSSSEYVILSSEVQTLGETSEAERCLRKAVDASASTLEKAQTLIWLGNFYFKFGPRHSLDKGRDAFQRAAQSLEQQSDPYAIDLRGQAFETWAAAELRNGFIEQANAKLEQARTIYTTLPKDFPYRAARLGNLDRRVKTIVVSVGPESPLLGGLKPPEDVGRVLQQLSSDDLRAIAEQDGGSVFSRDGNDESENHKQKQHYERLAAVGLVTFSSNVDVKAAGKKDNTHFDYGVTTTDLYNKTREFIFTALTQTLTNAKLSH